jgi:hypothetical protein
VLLHHHQVLTSAPNNQQVLSSSNSSRSQRNSSSSSSRTPMRVSMRILLVCPCYSSASFSLSLCTLCCRGTAYICHRSLLFHLCLDTISHALLLFFLVPRCNSHAEHGIMVTPAVRDSSGAITSGSPFLHFAVLAGVFADSPARAALMYTIKCFVAYFACPFCKLVGTMIGSTVRFCGYCQPVFTHAGVGQGKSYQMGAQDGRLLSDLEQRAQAAAAAFNRARGFEPPPGNRFKGSSPLLQLYWVRISSLFVVPFSHSFHLGVFKNLISRMFAKESRQQVGACTCRGWLRCCVQAACIVSARVSAVTCMCVWVCASHSMCAIIGTRPSAALTQHDALLHCSACT